MKVFYITLMSLLLFYSCNDSAGRESKKTTGSKVTLDLKIAPMTKAGVENTIRLPAQLAAYQEVSIFPKVNGYVQKVNVDIGSRVRKGDLLMQLEAPELEQASLQAKEKYARTRSDYSLDLEHYQRLLEASTTPGAISPLDLSTARSKMIADSSLSNAERNNWQMQQTMQSYLVVRAPFDGVITERNVHPGALVSATNKDRPMLELKQTRILRLQVDLPEKVASSVKIGDTAYFYVNSLPGRVLKGVISRKSMNVNLQMRTERVELDIPNPEGWLAPGMFVEISFVVKGDPQAYSVPRSAVIISTERKYVILVRNGKTLKLDVITGNENKDRMEIFGKFEDNDQVIVNGSDETPEGLAVTNINTIK